MAVHLIIFTTGKSLNVSDIHQPYPYYQAGTGPPALQAITQVGRFRRIPVNFYDLPLGVTPPPVAPVLAAPEATLGFFLNSRLIALVNGTMAVFANHGVAQTLSIKRRGRRALVIA